MFTSNSCCIKYFFWNKAEWIKGHTHEVTITFILFVKNFCKMCKFLNFIQRWVQEAQSSTVSIVK